MTNALFKKLLKNKEIKKEIENNFYQGKDKIISYRKAYEIRYSHGEFGLVEIIRLRKEKNELPYTIRGRYFQTSKEYLKKF